MKEEIIKLTNTVNELMKFIAKTPDKNLEPKEWGIREILIHLVFWHQSFERTIFSLMKNEEPKLPTGTYRELNAKAIKKFESFSIEEIINQLMACQRNIERDLENPQLENKSLSFKTGGKAFKLEQAILRVESHIRNHLLKMMILLEGEKRSIS